MSYIEGDHFCKEVVPSSQPFRALLLLFAGGQHNGGGKASLFVFLSPNVYKVFQVVFKPHET